jgi:hypothetical protein
MTVVRRTLAVALSAVLVVSLAGCASDTERYCDTLSEKKQTLTDLAASEDGDVLEQTLDVLRDLRDEAPSDIEDEWSTLVFAYETLGDAFEDAGTSPGEYDPASPPADVTEEQAKRIEGAAAELRSARVMQAADGLEQHARDVCKVDLGLGSG